MKNTSIEAIVEILELFNRKLGVIPRSEFEEKKAVILESLREENALDVIAEIEEDKPEEIMTQEETNNIAGEDEAKASRGE